MKHLTVIFIFLVVKLSLQAQEIKKSQLYEFIADKQLHGTSFVSENIFEPLTGNNISGNTVLPFYAGLSLNRQQVNKIFINKPAGLSLSIPVTQLQSMTLVLAAALVNDAGDFSFGTIDNNINTKTSTDQGLHYRGYISGDTNSLACVSFFENGEVMGVFANQAGNYIIGRIKNSDTGYVVYKSSDMLIQPRYQCTASELNLPGGTISEPLLNAPSTGNAPPPVLCKKVRLYWEGDYSLYSYNFKSNLTDVQNYLTGLFNIVATIYQNEGIVVELSKSYVWTTADPYSHTSSGNALTSFKNRWNGLGNNYYGDLAHLISGGTTNNGGVAYILNLDQCNRPFTYGYSNVYGSFQTYPGFSWDAQVVTHEIGHNLGSRHTHWCGWNTGPANTCGAIDNCSAADVSTGCTTCPSSNDTANLPAGFKGTIMSYCYLKNGIGVDFVNGFGPLPQAAIRNNVNSATCFTTRNFWKGTVSTAWNNGANWSCGSIPDGNTDVIINTGLTNYPLINSPATCRSINQLPGSDIRINTGFKLTITGKSR